MSKSTPIWVAVLATVFLFTTPAQAAPHKAHTVVLGAGKKVPYSRVGDPAGAAPNEIELRVRALLVDGVLKEWTTGDPHDVTDRSFVVRRAVRINDNLPDDATANKPAENKTVENKTGEKKPADNKPHWVWQRGPWLMVDRVTGHIAPLKLPDYDPGVSQPVWFRDYAAYCGITSSGKSLYAVVAQIAARKPVLAKKLTAWDAASPVTPACDAAEWQREPLHITFHPTGHDAVGYDLIPGSAVLVEESGDEPETPAVPAKP